jgi:class 3 adenylate cyclase/predicted ATPase
MSQPVAEARSFATLHSDFQLHETADGTIVWRKQRRAQQPTLDWQRQVDVAARLDGEPVVYQSHRDQFYLYLPESTWYPHWFEGRVPVPTETLRAQALGLLDVLERWHQRGIAWLGLAPAHLLYRPDTHEFLPTEWPLALAYRDRAAGTPQARIDEEILSYASPEQSGKTDLPLDYRSDYFSLGVLLYQLATGQRPFAGSDGANTLFRILTHTPPPAHELNPTVPPSLSAILTKLLAKNPADRYQSAAGLRHDLQRVTLGSGEGFVAGRSDAGQEFQLTTAFVGRETVRTALEEVLRDVGESATKGWVRLEGPPGSGKTALLDVLENAYFNRYFLLRSDARDDRAQPYAGLRAGLEALVNYLLSQPTEVVDSLRFHLESGLGDALPVLVEFCPACGPLTDRPPAAPSPQRGSQATQYRQAYALAGFFKALVLTGRPVVWLLDNLQGASDVTLALLDALFRETSLGAFTVVATNESGTAPDLLTEALASLDVRHRALALPDLSASELETWLRSLRLQPEQVGTLAALIGQKTGGTPYFVRRFLETAQRRNLLHPIPGTAFFRADERALAAFETTHNLLGYLTEAIRQLPPPVRYLFDIAACFQPRFSGSELAALSQQPVEEVPRHVEVLLQAGVFIRDSEPGYLTFANPQLIDIGREQLATDHRAEVFERVARYLLAQPGPLSTDDRFRLATKLLEIPPERGASYAPHLLEAARAAVGIGAFELALRCYGYALKTLTPADWDQRYDDCFDLHGQYLHAAAFAPGTEAEFEQTLGFLQEKVRTKFHAAALATVWAAHLAYRQRLDESIRVAMPALRQFGIRLRYEPSIPRLIASLLQANWLLRKQSPERIEQLPEIQDSEAASVVKLLQVIQDGIFLSRPVMLPETMLLQLHLSMQRGLSEISGAGFMAYAFMRASLQGQYRDAQRWMDLALRLDRRFGVVRFELTAEFLKAVFVDHWLAPLADSIQNLHANYRRCRENGLLSLSFYSLGSASVYEFYSGLPLDVVQQKSLDGLRLAESQQQSLMASFFRMVAQGCHDLRQSAPERALFDGPHAVFEREETDFQSLNDLSSLSILMTFHLKISVLLNRTETALPTFKRLIAYGQKTGEGSYTAAQGYFYGGLACLLPAVRPAGETGRLARKAIARIKKFSQVFAGNHGAKYELLRGLYALRSGQTDAGLLVLDRAIEAAVQHQLPIDEALAHEFKGAEYLRLGNQALARRELREALLRYSAWGAGAKVAALRQTYAFLDAPTGANAGVAVPSEAGRPSIDLLSFLKASNSIAGSVRLDVLLQNLLDVLLENAGAQKAALLLNQAGHLSVYALQEYGAGRVQQPMPLAEAPLPQNLIRYVVRTGQPLALAQAYTDRLFSADAYFQQHRTLSALAMPVIKNQQCLAVLYLENNSTPGAFHPQRLEILHLLSSQIAISLENALLYDEMEARIQDRTVQLQREMDKSERLLLNILPQAVAQELKQTGQATARQYDDVTVLFTDFVNFTKISELMGPDDLVHELDYCFRGFDEITERYGIEKIKTIGDAYLGAGGLQDDDPGDHTERVVQAALTIRDFIEARKTERQAAGRPYFELRIGVHNGPVVAGVVGSRKFAYDIWGDTVNTAARMEQSGEPGQVNVSGRTWAVVQHAFAGTFRGGIRAKNKGEIEMYFVTGRR